jgi:hypothetical protein
MISMYKRSEVQNGLRPMHPDSDVRGSSGVYLSHLVYAHTYSLLEDFRKFGPLVSGEIDKLCLTYLFHVLKLLVRSACSKTPSMKAAPTMFLIH